MPSRDSSSHERPPFSPRAQTPIPPARPPLGKGQGGAGAQRRGARHAPSLPLRRPLPAHPAPPAAPPTTSALRTLVGTAARPAWRMWGEMVRFLLRRPGTRLERGGVEGSECRKGEGGSAGVGVGGGTKWREPDSPWGGGCGDGGGSAANAPTISCAGASACALGQVAVVSFPEQATSATLGGGGASWSAPAAAFLAPGHAGPGGGPPSGAYRERSGVEPRIEGCWRAGPFLKRGLRGLGFSSGWVTYTGSLFSASGQRLACVSFCLQTGVNRGLSWIVLLGWGRETERAKRPASPRDRSAGVFLGS